MTVCAEAATGHHAIELFRSTRPDVTLMDLRLPDLSGTDAIRAHPRRVPGRKSHRALDVCRRRRDLRRARSRRARLPGEDRRTGRACRHHPQGRPKGRRHVPPALAARLALRSPRSHLSPRELAVLKLMVMGKRNKEIAGLLDITEGTVKIHVSNILVKLGVADRTRGGHASASARDSRPRSLTPAALTLHAST